MSEVELNEEELGQIIDQLLGGEKTLGDIRGLTTQEIEAIYTVAYNLFENAKYEDALKVFGFLCLYSHLDKRFWLGAAACHQQLKNFAEAVDAYSMTAVLDVEDPTPSLQAAMCYLSMGNLDKAESGCESAIHWSGENVAHAATKARAEALLGVVREQKGA